MNTIGFFQKTVYLTAGETHKEYLHENPYASKSAPKEKTAVKNAAMRSKLRQLNGTDTSSAAGKNKNTLADTLIGNMQNYAEKLKADRNKSRETANGVKKLKYRFKDISSKIIHSKTSTAARQAVTQAKREVMRLTKEKNKGGYDPEEMEAAIAHAKAMERVARKKARHLEEEEMAAAARRAKRDPLTDEEYDKELKPEETDEDIEKAEKSGQGEEYPEDDTYEAMETEDELIMDRYDESILPDEIEVTDPTYENALSYITAMDGLLDKLSDDLTEELEALMEEIGLSELTESFMGVDTDIDAQDLKELKMKHRNREMKEMVEADAKYLKAVFEHLSKQKNAGGLPGMSCGHGSPGISAVTGGFTPSNPVSAATAIAAFSPTPEPAATVIDIAL